MRVAGLGCQRGCSADALLSLISLSLQRHDLTIADLSALASIDLKRHEPGILALAQQLGLPLRFFSAGQLAGYESQLSQSSRIAFDHTGCYGVAESAALALASQKGPAALLITRQQSTLATFALAISLSQEHP